MLAVAELLDIFRSISIVVVFFAALLVAALLISSFAVLRNVKSAWSAADARALPQPACSTSRRTARRRSSGREKQHPPKQPDRGRFKRTGPGVGDAELEDEEVPASPMHTAIDLPTIDRHDPPSFGLCEDEEVPASPKHTAVHLPIIDRDDSPSYALSEDKEVPASPKHIAVHLRIIERDDCADTETCGDTVLGPQPHHDVAYSRALFLAHRGLSISIAKGPPGLEHLAFPAAVISVGTMLRSAKQPA